MGAPSLVVFKDRMDGVLTNQVPLPIAVGLEEDGCSKGLGSLPI